MRQLITVLLSAMLLSCNAPAPAPAPEPAPPPEPGPAQLEPYQVYQSAEFAIVASNATACASSQASKQNLANNFVIGDAPSINRQFPRVHLAGTTDQPLYAVMSLLNSDDTMPQWIVTAENIGNDRSLVSLRNGGEYTENIAKFQKIWSAVRNCDS